MDIDQIEGAGIRDAALSKVRLATATSRGGAARWWAETIARRRAIVGSEEMSRYGEGMGKSPDRILFVTWDGPGQSYLETLYLPIFVHIAQSNPRLTFDVLQYSWGAREAVSVRETAVRGAGFGFHHGAIGLPNSPLGKATSLMVGTARLVQVTAARRISVVLARSLMPAAMALAACAVGARWKWCFDVDGFMADERFEHSGAARPGLEYWALRQIERRALRSAAMSLTRTENSRALLVARAGSRFDEGRIRVVHNGRDSERFRPRSNLEGRRTRARYGVSSQAPWLIALGSFGGQYLPDETLALFEWVKELAADARLLWATAGVEEARQLLRTRGIQGARVERLSEQEVPRVLSAATCGLALRRPSFSQVAVSPVKIGEYLLSGLPVVATAKVGDIDEQLADCEAVRLIDDATPEVLKATAEWIVGTAWVRRDELSSVARRRGLEHFGLELCGSGYHSALLKMLEAKGSSPSNG